MKFKIIKDNEETEYLQAYFERQEDKILQKWKKVKIEEVL